MRNFKNMAAVIGALLLITVVGYGQTAINPSDAFVLLATSRTSTMQKELDEVAEKGFRVAIGSGLSGDEIAVMMEKTPDGSEKYAYKLLATTQTGTMEKEINSAAKEGFRLHPKTLTTKTGVNARSVVLGGSSSRNTEIVVIMERDPNQTGKEYEYKLLATSRTGTLQKEMTEAAKEGYVLAAFGSRGEHLAIMEREKK